MTSIDNLTKLNDKVALVTGAGSGIGRAITLRLHEAGAKLVLVDSDEDSVKALAGELEQDRSDSSVYVAGDISEAETSRAMCEAALEHFGRVDILVNNAGIFPNQPLSQMSEEDFSRVLDVNLKGVYHTTKSVSEAMKSQGDGGRIVNVTSIDALHPSMSGLAHYDASKHGLWGFTKNVALELAEHEIWVNAVAPGGVATPGVANLGSSDDGPDIESFIEAIPMKRMGDPDDIAKAVLFLSSELSSYMTGSQIVVDGGKLLT